MTDLVCDLYEGGMGTTPIREELSVKIEDKQLTIHTSMTSRDGAPIGSMKWAWKRK